MTADIEFIQDVAAQVGNCPVHFGATHIHPQHHKAIRIELEQRAAPSAAPLAGPLQPDKAFRHQAIHDTHDRRQADIQSFGDGSAGDRAFPADDLQDGRTVDIAHGGSGDRKRVSH